LYRATDQPKHRFYFLLLPSGSRFSKIRGARFLYVLSPPSLSPPLPFSSQLQLNRDPDLQSFFLPSFLPSFLDLDYQNVKPEYLNQIWKVINFDEAEVRFAKAI
jgi:hypothetical protein